MRYARRRRPLAGGIFFLLTSILFAAGAPAVAASFEPWTGGGVTPFVLRDVDGRSHELSAYRGNVVLVNFWATWCEPCRQEMPSIQRLRDKLAGKPFAAFAVNVDEPEARVRTFIKQTGFDLPVLLDPNKTLTRSWGVRVLPVTFLIDRDGRVRYRAIGDFDWADEKIVGIISQLMAGG